MIGNIKTKRRNVYKIVFRKSGEMRKVKRAGHRWKDNIRMNLREIGCENMNWNDGGL
jgi:hypothetical protein